MERYFIAWVIGLAFIVFVGVYVLIPLFARVIVTLAGV